MVLIKPMCDVSKTNYTNLVIGYFNGKVIVKNDFGHLYYMICEEQIAPVGTFLESDLLAPVKNLPEAEPPAPQQRSVSITHTFPV